jgi:TonB-dependent Receptor Plug Domain
MDNAVRLFGAGARRWGSLLAISLIGCWPAAGAEPAAETGGRDLTELSLEELGTLKVSTVYGASKHEQKTSEAPSSVSIVTAEDIQEYGYRTLADVLRAARGFYVSYNRAYNFIGVRGFNRPGDFGGRILIMIDGHRLNDPIYDSNFAGTEFPLDMDLVDKIEISSVRSMAGWPTTWMARRPRTVLPAYPTTTFQSRADTWTELNTRRPHRTAPCSTIPTRWRGIAKPLRT